MSNYFTVDEAEMFSFYRIPKSLFANPVYKKISTDAKVLYGLLLERNSLSVKNKWVDDLGRVYIYFSKEEAMEMLGCSHDTIPKAFKHLVSVDLIEEKRQGLGKSNIIYVKKFILETIEKSKTSENLSSGVQKIGVQDLRKSDGSNTYSNNTYLNNNNSTTKNCNTKIPKEKNVVVDSQFETLINGFKTKYQADLDPKRANTLIKLKGIDHVQECITTYGDYLQGRTINNIGGDFYTFCSKGYTKPVSQTAKTISQFNFDQREYSEEELESCYTNVNE